MTDTPDQEVNVQDEEETEVSVSYVCPNAPGFTFRLGKTRVRFNQGALTLTDSNLIELLDGFIKTLPTFRRLVKKVDKNAALKLMQEHQAARGGATKGGLTSQSHQNVHAIPVAGDAALGNLSVEQQEKLIDDVKADSGLNLTKIPAESTKSPLSQLNLSKKP